MGSSDDSEWDDSKAESVHRKVNAECSKFSMKLGQKFNQNLSLKHLHDSAFQTISALDFSETVVNKETLLL